MTQEGSQGADPQETHPPDSQERPNRSRAELMSELGGELRRILHAAERREGRGRDKAALARQLSVSRNSVYAYLDGRRLPSAAVLDALLVELGATTRERRGLGEIRDLVADRRYHRGRSQSPPPCPDPDDVPDDVPGDVPGDVPDDVPGPAPGRHRRVLVAAVLALVLVAAAGAGAIHWAGRGDDGPVVVVAKGLSARGQRTSDGGTCSDPSCAFADVRLRGFRANHTYKVICKATGGEDPLENRSGYTSRKVVTDARGRGNLTGRSSCMWGYQATQLWVTVISIDGLPPVDSNRVDW
jgi:hypothetical protein